MTLAAIQTILDDFPGWTSEFDLLFADEISRQQSGRTRVKDVGSGPLWRLRAQSYLLKPSEHRYWKARLHSLENGKGSFYGYDLAGCYPILYPNGTWPTGGSFSGASAQISSLNVDNKRIALKTLPAGYEISVGDYLAFDYGSSRALHQAMEEATADGSGVTAQFEVRPHIRTGAAVDALVTVKRAAAVMMLLPGTLAMPADPNTAFGTISFEAIQVL